LALLPSWDSNLRNLREMIVLIVVSICQEKIVLEGHQDQIYSLAWSQCGRFLATVCRDGKVRIYDPRGGSTPVRLVASFLIFFFSRMYVATA
jgi:WD40 repeat protein